MDYIITVCNNVAGESCPIWPVHPLTGHWYIQDPAGTGSTDDERGQASELAYRTLMTKIQKFIDQIQLRI